jgi:hypothetical protein
MKKLFITLMVISVFAYENASAQIEISGYTGWVPASRTAYSYNGYRLRIEGSQNYGASFGVTTPIGLVEFNYMGFSSFLKQDGGIVDIIQRQPINVNYYQLGVLKTLMEHEKLIPYGMFTLGASNFNPTEDSANPWRFTITAGLGLRYFFTPTVGIRLQARLLMPLYFGGIGFGCGIGTGGASCGGGAGFGSEILQGDFTGGVVLRLGNGG